MTDSRRHLVVPHAAEPERLARCPICQWAIAQDHDEAVAMHRAWTGAEAPVRNTRPAASAAEDVEDAAAVVAFALV